MAVSRHHDRGVGLAALAPAMSQHAPLVDAVAALLEALRGPFISDPDVIARQDHLDPGGDWAHDHALQNRLSSSRNVRAASRTSAFGAHG
jgi:hypothetical protein